MPTFKCHIRGEGFPAVLVRGKGTCGFYATRWIDAGDAAEAELLALALLKDDASLRSRRAMQGPRHQKSFLRRLKRLPKCQNLEAAVPLGSKNDDY
jgi:hypothetical protein